MTLLCVLPAQEDREGRRMPVLGRFKSSHAASWGKERRLKALNTSRARLPVRGRSGAVDCVRTRRREAGAMRARCTDQGGEGKKAVRR